MCTQRTAALHHPAAHVHPTHCRPAPPRLPGSSVELLHESLNLAHELFVVIAQADYAAPVHANGMHIHICPWESLNVQNHKPK